METKDWNFNFVVEGLTAEQADHLMDIVISFAEALNTFVGGGFAPVEEVQDEQSKTS